MAPFWVPNIIRHLLFRVPKKEPLFCQLPIYQGPGCFFFLLWPLFARAPCHWFLEIFLLSSPGVQSVFFCCAPLGAATFRRGQSKKKNKVFFVFCSGPVPVPNGASPSPAFRRGRSKKTHPGWCFFCSNPAERSRRPTGRNKKKNILHTRGRQQKKFQKPMTRGTSKKGPQQKTKAPTQSLRPWTATAMLTHFFSGRLLRLVFFFFLLRPRADAHSLTHCGPGRRCLPPG